MNTVLLPELNEEKKQILLQITTHLDDKRMGYIKVPTGWGKTFLAKYLMRQYYDEGKAVLFLVSRNNQLLDQTFYSDSDSDSKEPLFPNSVALYSDNKEKKGAQDLAERIEKRNSGIVVFASLQTIDHQKGNREIKYILQNHMDLVVIDEIHNFIDNQGNQFIAGINQKTRVLGMTATPFQGVVGNVKFVDEISRDMCEIFSKTLPKCILHGQLSELNYVIIHSHQSILDVFDFKKGAQALDQELCLDGSTEEHLRRVIQRTYLAQRVYSDQIDNGSKTLIFCAPVRNVVNGLKENEKVNAFHAKLSAAIFNGEIQDKFDPAVSLTNKTKSGQFKQACYLSSDLAQQERGDLLKAFKEIGRPPFVLCTVGTLIEGFDFPDLHNLILLRPTLSMRLFEQQVGRVTRKGKYTKKDRGNIFEIADDIDSLYDKFSEQVFNERVMDRIHMLRPENRVEELFTEGSNTEAITAGKISILGIDFRDDTPEISQYPVHIPPISMRAMYSYKLLNDVDKKTMGSLTQEKRILLRVALGFKVTDMKDAEAIAEIIEKLDNLEIDALKDGRLSDKCRESKPKLFNEVKWLLRP